MPPLVSAPPIPMPDGPQARRGQDLLGLAGPIAGSHVLVLGGRDPELLGRLIRQDCLAATVLRRGEKPEAGLFDIVLAPCVAPADCLDGLVHQARRALVPTGAFAARLGDAATEFRAMGLVRRLRLNGFVGVRMSRCAGAVLVRASLPAFDLAFRT